MFFSGIGPQCQLLDHNPLISFLPKNILSLFVLLCLCWVVYFRATWHISAQAPKIKKICPQKDFLYSRKQNLSAQAPQNKNKKRNSLYFRKWNFLILIFCPHTHTHFLASPSKSRFWISFFFFLIKAPNGNLAKILMFQERELSYTSGGRIFLYFRKWNFLTLLETKLYYISGKVYSEPMHI